MTPRRTYVEPSEGFVYPDEVREQTSKEAIELARDAIGFVVAIVAKSRTGRAALLRLTVVDSLFSGHFPSREIAKRFGVSVRVVQRLRKELRAEFFGRKFAK